MCRKTGCTDCGQERLFLYGGCKQGSEREKGVRKEWRGRFWDFFWYKNVMNETDKENEAEGYMYTTQTVHVVQISKWDIKERGLEGGGFKRMERRDIFSQKGLFAYSSVNVSQSSIHLSFAY